MFRASPAAIQQAAWWLVEAERPMIVVGPEVAEDGATAELLALAEKLSIPVTDTEDDLYANFPTDHALYMGPLRALRYPRQADLVIGFGESCKRRRPQPGTTAIHVSHDSTLFGKVYPVDLAIASDVRLAILDLSDAIDSQLTRDRISRIRSTRLADVSKVSAQFKASADIAFRAMFDRSPVTWERVGK